MSILCIYIYIYIGFSPFHRDLLRIKSKKNNKSVLAHGKRLAVRGSRPHGWQRLIAHALEALRDGLAKGGSGNVSQRLPNSPGTVHCIAAMCSLITGFGQLGTWWVGRGVRGIGSRRLVFLGSGWMND